MKRQISMAVCITLGSLALYCGQNMTVSMNNSDGGSGGTVKDASAQMTGSCCTPTAPSYTKLWEGDITDAQPTADIAVGPYRQVIMYVTSPSWRK